MISLIICYNCWWVNEPKLQKSYTIKSIFQLILFINGWELICTAGNPLLCISTWPSGLYQKWKILIKELSFQCNVVDAFNNQLMKQERGRKKYAEKQPPDKPQKKEKPKYVPKESVEVPQKTEEKTYHKPQRSGYVRPKKEYIEKPQLLERVSSQVDEKHVCLICSEGIRRKQPIWTCRQCFISLHLRCIRQWIFKSNEERQKKSRIIFNWNCVQCKNQYSEELPKYYCYCGKYQNPQFERDLEPHSCGRICERKRGTFCPHLCPNLCHSGKCNPCQFQGALVNCFCGKNSRMVKCSQQRQSFQCGKKCEKLLNCGKHKCQRNCHAGDCFPCKKKHMAKCFCGKNDDVIDCAKDSYSCEQQCGKILNCGFHKCEELCHEGQCKQCQKTPQKVKKCPCGRFDLMMLSVNERQSCQDPIPVCGTPCKKKLICGHECSLSCHEGKCADCKVIIDQSCSCGNTHRKIQCWKARVTKDEFKCDKVCKKRKSCGLHFCNVQCCKFRTSPFIEDHKCENTCQKMLNCGKHNCGQPCHAGLCKKCPVLYSQPQFCPCGSTSKKPPISCGTVIPQCDNPCNKEMECGHQCQELCHYGKCRCYEKVFVKCRCGKQNIETTCGRQTLCLNKCQNQLKCGHKCLIQCHAGSCEQANNHGCNKKCDKVRSDCGHKCKQICHMENKCEDFPCQAEIMIKCQCGHRQTSILCGSSEGNAGKKKQIACNKKCENLKRFDILYKDKEVYYPNGMMQFGFKNFKYLEKLQARLEKFILQSDDHFIEVDFKFMGNNQARIVLHNLFQNHYHLNTHFYRHMKSASFTLMQTEDTMIPKPCLSQYIKQVAKGTIKRNNLPFEYTVKFQGEEHHKNQQVFKTLKAYLHQYYVERKDKMVLIHFWNKTQALQAKAFIESHHPMIEFYGEDNQIYEEEEEEIQLSEIIEQEMVQQQKQQMTETHQKRIQSPKQQEPQETQKQEKTEKPEKQEKQEEIKEQVPKAKIIKKQGPKIIIRKSTPNFNRSQYPPSTQNVQDIYKIDDDELDNIKVNWDEIIHQLLSKKMGLQASQWRLRSLIMISDFHSLKQEILKDEFTRILDMYQKDKEKARRILEIQKIDIKKIKQEMNTNQIYLSDHQPQIVSYALFFNYFALDKIEMKVPEQCQETREIQRAVEIIQAVEQCNLEEFYEEVSSSDYVLNCILVPFIHEIRWNFLKKLQKKQKFKANNLHKYLFFGSEQELIEYAKMNSLIIQKKFSKSRKEHIYSHVEGQLNKERMDDNGFRAQIKDKRDKKYFLSEPQELIDDKWMTRSFFAFGDFKESIAPKYMLALCKSLRDG